MLDYKHKNINLKPKGVSMITEYNLPLSTITMHRTIEAFTEDQAGIACDFFWVMDSDGRTVHYGPLCYVSIKDLIVVHS